MKKGFWAEQWYKYRRKKTLLGILFDLLFTVFVIAMIFPASRKVVSATIIRYSMFQPHQSEDVAYLSNDDLRWSVEDMDGNVVELSNFNGNPVFVNFWATWCPPCIAEMPSIQSLYDEYGDDVVFIIASQESKGIISEFIEKKGFTFPVYMIRSHVPNIFSSRSIPASFLISPEGQIMIKKQGAARWDGKNVKDMLDKMLGI